MSLFTPPPQKKKKYFRLETWWKSSKRRVWQVALGDEELRLQLHELGLQLRQLVVGLLHDVVHVRDRLLVLRNLPQVLSTLFDLQ